MTSGGTSSLHPSSSSESMSEGEPERETGSSSTQDNGNGAVITALKEINVLLQTLAKHTEKELKSVKKRLKTPPRSSESSFAKEHIIPLLVRVSTCTCKSTREKRVSNAPALNACKESRAWNVNILSKTDH